MESVELLMWYPSYDLNLPSELENTSPDVFKTNFMHDFCNLTKKLTISSGRVMCSALHFYSLHRGGDCQFWQKRKTFWTMNNEMYTR